MSPPGKGEGRRADDAPSSLPTTSTPSQESKSSRILRSGSDKGRQHAVTVAHALAEAADIALDTGRDVTVAGYVLIPDTLAVELAANNPGEPWPQTWQIVRDDGRTVLVFRAPAGWSR